MNYENPFNSGMIYKHGKFRVKKRDSLINFSFVYGNLEGKY